MNCRSISGIVTLTMLAGLGVATFAQAQEWPTKPVKIIVAFGPGGTADILGRTLATELSIAFNQTFYVENKPGNSGAIGSALVTGAKSDGYTLLIGGAGPLLVGPAVNPNIIYDTMRDFTHIAIIAGDSNMLAAGLALKVENFADFLTVARSRPTACGTSGAGSQGHLVVELINRKTGSKLQPVPYRGAAEAMTDLIGGHVQCALEPAISIGEHAIAGEVVGLAVTADQRLSSYKDVPTFVETGYDINGTAWFWLAGPKNMPAGIVAKLNHTVRRIVELPKVKEQFAQSAMSTSDLDVAGTRAFIAGEVALWGSTARQVGLKVQ
jgi:tripartite-type tricarboxylate transporter receptor subunit TctC